MPPAPAPRTAWGSQRGFEENVGDSNRGKLCLYPGQLRRETAAFSDQSLEGAIDNFCGVTADSTAYCWGVNVWHDTTASGLHKNVTSKIQGTVAWTDISPGIHHTCGLSNSIP